MNASTPGCFVLALALALTTAPAAARPPHGRLPPAASPAHRAPPPPPSPHGRAPAPPDWDHGHWHHGYHGGHTGWWWVVGFRWYFVDPWYPYWRAWPPEQVIVVERDRVEAEAPGPAPAAYWYRCDDPKGYYPYVNDCPGGWTPVPAVPPDAGKKP